jgi:hypothetical protein
VTPGVKVPAGADERPLGPADRELYRSNTMRLVYLASDRPELQFAGKELARYMQQPTAENLVALKRTGRFLIGARRLVQQFVAQDPPGEVRVCTDSDHAGCLKTRKSTSGCYVFHGKHLLRASSTTQGVIALSTGESEFYAAVKGASVGLGTVNMWHDMGVQITQPVKLLVDATAGIGIASRRGVGRIRHLHTPSLWIQRAIHDGRIAMDKIAGEENPADAGTKHIDGAGIKRMWQTCGMVLRQGGSAKALKAAVAPVTSGLGRTDQ